MKIRYRGQTRTDRAPGRYVGRSAYDFILDDIKQGAMIFALSAPRLRRLQKELGDLVDGEVSQYFASIHRAIMAQAQGLLLPAYGIGIPSRMNLSPHTVSNKRSFRRRPWPVKFYGSTVPNTNLLRFKPGLVGPDRHLVFTGNTVQVIKQADWRDKLGKTQVELGPKLKQLAAQSDKTRWGSRQVGRGVEVSYAGASEVQTMLDEITIRVAPRASLSRLSQGGDDPLADRLFTGRTASLLRNKRILSPVMDFMLRKRVPALVSKFTQRLANNILRDRRD